MEPGPSISRSTSLTGSSPRALGRAQAFANAIGPRIGEAAEPPHDDYREEPFPTIEQVGLALA